MSEKINDGGSAFPAEQHQCQDGTWNQTFDPGMSLRDYFAAQVACGMAAFSGTAGVSYGPGQIAGRSYEIADAMLKAREASS